MNGAKESLTLTARSLLDRRLLLHHHDLEQTLEERDPPRSTISRCRFLEDSEVLPVAEDLPDKLLTLGSVLDLIGSAQPQGGLQAGDVAHDPESSRGDCLWIRLCDNGIGWCRGGKDLGRKTIVKG